MTHIMMAWLGAFLKSFPPSPRACCRSARWVCRVIGAGAVSGACPPAGVTLLGDDVAMSLSPSRCFLRAAVALVSPKTGRRRAVCGNDHDQARREDSKPELALSRTEPTLYA